MTIDPPPPFRPLGRSGLAVSSLAWGMWRFAGADAGTARALVEAALAAGITLFDTAEVYGADVPGVVGSAESLLGDVFADSPGLRDRIVLATKGGIVAGVCYDSSAASLTGSIEASLRRLRVERLDLYQIHRPDLLTHPDEIVRVVEAAYHAGKIGAFGVSNFTPAQTAALIEALPASGPALVATQPELSPLQLAPIEDGTLDQAIAHGITPLAWSPLGGGRIAAPGDARERAVAAALDAVAEAHGVTRTAAAYAWIMAHPARPIPIVGSQNPARIGEAAAAYRVRWTRADWYTVLVASRGVPMP